MRQNNARQIALGGMLAAVAMVIMCLIGLIPVATYVCPMLCCALQYVVLRFCGRRIAWAWFGVVAILAVLMAPDKEAAMVFLFLGYYPLIKPYFDRRKLAVAFKFLYFNISVLIAYFLMIYLLGLQQIVQENAELGMIGLVLIFLLGNVTFFMLDRLLFIMERKKR